MIMSLVNRGGGMRDLLAKELEIGQVPSAEDGKLAGKALRETVPHESFGTWSWEREGRDPNALLFSQDATRVQDLVPVRHERMAVSPFTYYRGSALLMATDLAAMPTTGLEVQVCGDAHIGNFGVFLSPERRMVWDINDFDETCRGPWEWDVARLCASVELCARARKFSPKEARSAVKAAARGYREAMRRFAKMGTLEMWYEHIDVDEALLSSAGLQDREARAHAKRVVKKARGKGSSRAVRKFTEVEGGHLRVVSQPPLIVPLRELFEGKTILGGKRTIGYVSHAALAAYRSTLPRETARLLEGYRPVDMARKVVGVGSVGLRAWILVCEGAGADDALVLQVKEAQKSVVETVLGSAGYRHHGQRVVEGQRAMQVASDLMLGWTRLPDAEHGKRRDYYVRQLWDGKGSANLDLVSAQSLEALAKICGLTLAHAHARTGNRFAIAGYLGKSDAFDKAMACFSRAYADQAEIDHESFVKAIG